ncbi:type II toxin-antitoxin system RelE/ParE family toxin [bacterium]|nr:type II toxin-antitoxin system RelE/ParE family toxin [bacterium]
MAGYKIVWSKWARSDLIEILEFYINRNGTATYSKKLNSKIKHSLKVISKNPKIGVETDFENVRAIITGDYQIIYEILEGVILVSMIWDCRRNPNSKKLGLRINR